jgi:hypothetical protein
MARRLVASGDIIPTIPMPARLTGTMALTGFTTACLSVLGRGMAGDGPGDGAAGAGAEVGATAAGAMGAVAGVMVTALQATVSQDEALAAADSTVDMRWAEVASPEAMDLVVVDSMVEAEDSTAEVVGTAVEAVTGKRE